MKNSRILTIIPARGGSKGIKDKNIVDICGKPLIEYTINPALELKKQGLVDEVIVSTDSEKIASISRQLGAAVPFLRPAEISDDKAKSIDFVLHALDFFKNQEKFFDAVLLLQPTSPLRTTHQIDTAIKLFVENNADSLISCYKEEYINDLVMYKKEKTGFLKPLNPLHNKGVRRQEHGEVFVRSGSIYITKVGYLYATHQIISDTPLLFEVTKSESINLDTLEDLKILRTLLCR